MKRRVWGSQSRRDDRPQLRNYPAALAAASLETSSGNGFSSSRTAAVWAPPCGWAETSSRNPAAGICSCPLPENRSPTLAPWLPASFAAGAHPELTGRYCSVIAHARRLQAARVSRAVIEATIRGRVRIVAVLSLVLRPRGFLQQRRKSLLKIEHGFDDSLFVPYMLPAATPRRPSPRGSRWWNTPDPGCSARKRPMPTLKTSRYLPLRHR